MIRSIQIRRGIIIKSSKFNGLIRYPEDTGFTKLPEFEPLKLSDLLSMSKVREHYSLYTTINESLKVLSKKIKLNQKQMADQAFTRYVKLRDAMIKGDSEYVENNAGKVICENFVKDFAEGKYSYKASVSFKNTKVQLCSLIVQNDKGIFAGGCKIRFTGDCYVNEGTVNKKRISQEVDLICRFGEKDERLEYNEKMKSFVVPWKVVEVKNIKWENDLWEKLKFWKRWERMKFWKRRK